MKFDNVRANILAELFALWEFLSPWLGIMAFIRILIVENRKASAADLQIRLEGMGYLIAGIAMSIDEAKARTKDLNPDLIVVNARLRSGAGAENPGGLIPPGYEIPIVYIVEHAGLAKIKELDATNPFGYIFLPFDDVQISAALQVAIGRGQTEREMYESRHWLGGILNSIADGVIVVDDEGLIRYINPAAQDLTGWNQVDAEGKTLSEVFTHLDEEINAPLNIGIINAHEDILKPATKYESLLKSRDGRLIPVGTHVSMLTGGDSTIKGVVLTFRDISMQREKIEEIQRQAHRVRALEQFASRLNSDLDTKAVLANICGFVNNALDAFATAVFLVDKRIGSENEMVVSGSQNPSAAITAEKLMVSQDVVESLIRSDHPIHIEDDVSKAQYFSDQGLFQENKIKTAVIAGIYRQQLLIGIVVSLFPEVREIVKEEEMALLGGLIDQAANSLTNASLFKQIKQGRERHRLLAKSLVEIQEAERRHIARDLHDHLGQSLTGIQFMLESTKNQSGAMLNASLEEIQKSVSDIIEQVRELSLSLRPSMLDDLGLLPTLLWHIDRYSKQTGIYVNFHREETDRRYPQEIEITAYRIVQEALTNVARYAQVKEVFVGLAEEEKILWVEVLDKGKGFDPSVNLERPSSGLGGMSERVRLVGGYLTLNSYTDQGTQIIAALPLDNQPLERRKYDRNGSHSG